MTVFLYSVSSLSVFTKGIFFVPTLLLAMCRPLGQTHALRRMIPGMVTLIVQDPIRVHLYRQVVIMIQDDRSMTSQKSRSTVQLGGIPW